MRRKDDLTSDAPAVAARPNIGTACLARIAGNNLGRSEWRDQDFQLRHHRALLALLRLFPAVLHRNCCCVSKPAILLGRAGWRVSAGSKSSANSKGLRLSWTHLPRRE
jgi:hypothetical protein